MLSTTGLTPKSADALSNTALSMLLATPTTKLMPAIRNVANILVVKLQLCGFRTSSGPSYPTTKTFWLCPGRPLPSLVVRRRTSMPVRATPRAVPVRSRFGCVAVVFLVCTLSTCSGRAVGIVVRSDWTFAWSCTDVPESGPAGGSTCLSAAGGMLLSPFSRSLLSTDLTVDRLEAEERDESDWSYSFAGGSNGRVPIADSRSRPYSASTALPNLRYCNSDCIVTR